MEVLFVAYPTCSTCMKAKQWLDDHGIQYSLRHIKDCPPTPQELKLWHSKSGLPLKKFYNTSGLVYKSLNLKDRLSAMTDEEQYALLASNGMLVKRPIVVGDSFVLVGFREADWAKSML